MTQSVVHKLNAPVRALNNLLSICHIQTGILYNSDSKDRSLGCAANNLVIHPSERLHVVSKFANLLSVVQTQIVYLHFVIHLPTLKPFQLK